MTADPETLEGLLAGSWALMARGLRVAMPGRIVSYDQATLTATVLPLIQDEDENESGEREMITLAQINGVPVVFPGSGGTRVRWPINVGDTVMLHFCSSPIGKWKIRGGVVDPADRRHHHLADAIAIPGLQDKAHATDADVMIEFTENGQIHAGGNQALVTRAEFLDHTHPYTDDGSPAVTGEPTVTITGTTVLKGG